MSVGRLPPPVEATFSYTADELPAAQLWAGQQMQAWGLSGGHVQAWLHTAAHHLPEALPGRVVLAYDAADRLLSFDVWLDGRRVFGMDDFL